MMGNSCPSTNGSSLSSVGQIVDITYDHTDCWVIFRTDHLLDL
jgi:hypothetical protein